MRYRSLFLAFSLLVLPAVPVYAEWTGIGAYFTEGDEQWEVAGATYRADQRTYGLRIEEKTKLDLRVGASFGLFDTRLVDPAGALGTEKYDGEFLSLYLRWPQRLSEHLALHSELDYRFYLGSSRDDDTIELDWDTFALTLGLGIRLGRVELRPFVEYRRVDGDISGAGPTRLIDGKEQQGSGLVLQLEVDRYAYLRVGLHSGTRDEVNFTLAREF